MLESFDWNTIGKKQENHSEAEREKLDAMYGKTLSAVSESQIVEGVVRSE